MRILLLLFMLCATAALAQTELTDITTDIRVGEYERAIKTCDRLLRSNPNDSTVHELKARAYYKLADNVRLLYAGGEFEKLNLNI